ncbi:MAG: hypothetical protein ACTSSE_16655 [Candidatus Thorarchaeota archaeon]
MTEAAVVWTKESWEVPPEFPRSIRGITTVGVPLPHFIRVPLVYKIFKLLWRRHDTKNWFLLPYKRRRWEKRILKRFWDFEEYIREDGTPTFYQHINLMRERGGGVIVISGSKGEGKSILAQMIACRLLPGSVPYVIWEHKDLRNVTETLREMDVVVITDEDLTATGENSKNLLVHIDNSRQTVRKTDLFIISTGVSADGSSESVDLWFEPCGYNKKYQVTRFAVFGSAREFLGFVALQRKHRPDDPVHYYTKLSTWAEYESRATDYSKKVMKEAGTTGAVDSAVQDRHIAALVDYLQTERLDKGKDIPSAKKCRRLYRKAKLPQISIGYMDEVIQWAIDELEENEVLEEDSYQRDIEISFKGWKKLATGIKRLSKCEETAQYYVPFKPKATAGDIIEKFELEVLDDTFRKAKNRGKRRIKTSDLGKLGERWLASHIDSYLAPKVGSGSKEDPDILIIVNGVTTAINVKLSLEDYVRRELPTSPEHRWSHSLVALVLPRLLEIRLYTITGQSTMINSRKGVLCATDSLSNTIMEMIGNE